MEPCEGSAATLIEEALCQLVQEECEIHVPACALKSEGVCECIARSIYASRDGCAGETEENPCECDVDICGIFDGYEIMSACDEQFSAEVVDGVCTLVEKQ